MNEEFERMQKQPIAPCSLCMKNMRGIIKNPSKNEPEAY
jgi:hypothetical protein